MGGAAGGAVSFHGVYGVYDGELRVYGLGDLEEHPGEIVDIRPAIVKLRLFQTGYRAEQILYTAGISRS